MDTELLEFVKEVLIEELNTQKASLLFLQHQVSLPYHHRLPYSEPHESEIRKLVPNIEKLEKSIKLLESWTIEASKTN